MTKLEKLKKLVELTDTVEQIMRVEENLEKKLDENIVEEKILLKELAKEFKHIISESKKEFSSEFGGIRQKTLEAIDRMFTTNEVNKKLKDKLSEADTIFARIDEKMAKVHDGKDSDDKAIIEAVLGQIRQPIDGSTPTEEELKALIKPLIPEPLKGKDVDYKRLDKFEDKMREELRKGRRIMTPAKPVAWNIATDTANFNDKLSSTDSTIQKALDTLDDAVAGASTLAGLTDVTTTGVATGDFLQKSAGDWVDFDLFGTTNTWVAQILAAGTTIGTLTLANGSITASGGSISFGNENLSTTGTLTVGSMTISSLSITNSAGAVLFGDDSLTTTSFISSSGFRINDINTLIAEDGSSNLTFTDVVTGTKTLAELAAGGGSVSFGLVTEMPFTNAGTDDFDYSSNLTFNGSLLTIGTLVSQSIFTDNVTYGSGAGDSLISGALGNTLIGFDAGTALTNTEDSVIIGKNAGLNFVRDSAVIIGVGAMSAAADTTKNQQVVAIGFEAGKVNERNSCLFLGYQAGMSNTSTSQNTYIGYQAAFLNAGGAGNVFIGAGVAPSLTAAGDGNLIMGFGAVAVWTSGQSNTILGRSAAAGLTTGSNNTIVGASTAGGAGAFSAVTVFGYQAGKSATGSGNTFMGVASGSKSTGSFNSFFGSNAGKNTISGAQNSGFGVDAMQNNVSGDYNVVVGYRSMRLANGAGDNNVSLGGYAMGNGAGVRHRCIAIGRNAGYVITTGNDNVLIGYTSGDSITTGKENLLVGNYTGITLATGDSGNIFFGHRSGEHQTGVSNKFLISNINHTSAANELTQSIIYGVMSATTANQTLTFNATVKTTYGKIDNVKRIDDGDSPYTVLASDHIIFADTDGGVITINLPAGVLGTEYQIQNTGSSGNDVTINPDGTEQIFGGGAGVAFTQADSGGITIHFETTENWW